MAQLKLAAGHPQGLMTLFFSEMWERFCYYGMRVLLTLFLVKSLLKGDSDAALIYGAYTALIYAAPVLGGKMADQYLGYRYAILLGAVLMAIGEFLMVGGALGGPEAIATSEMLMLFGMGALIVGNGFFKANISTIVGKLYEDNDPRRDSGFTIFYIGINIGALLATTLVAFVGETYGFEYGFGLAGIGMLAGLFIFWSGRENYAAAPGLDITEDGHKKAGPLKIYQWISLGSLALIPACYFLISEAESLQHLLIAIFSLVAYQLISAGSVADGGKSGWEELKQIFRDGFNFRGRTSRKSYFLVSVTYYVITTLITQLALMVSVMNPDQSQTIALILNIAGGLFTLAAIIPGIALGVRRLHDSNHSGWLLLLLIVPIAQFYLVYLLVFKKGEPESNTFGAIEAEKPSMWTHRMFVLVVMMVINIVFWACFEQAGTSLTLFADRNVSREIFGWMMPASMTQFFNPAFIIIFGSIFSAMWVKLDQRGKNPSIPMKFALGILQLGCGFLVALIAREFANEQAMVPLLTLVILYLLHTTGELFLSPIGLSMVTKLSPKEIAGTAMGGWFLSFAMANYAGGVIASMTGGHGDSGSLLDPWEGLIKYTDVFATIGWTCVGIAVLIALLNKPLNKLMHGVK